VSDDRGLLFDIGDEKLMTIGTVVERLHDEFPDISVSKLRYLEEQGLVTPTRTKGGYRLFSRDDYRRLVRVLTMQRDDYLPLKVIRKEVERSAGVVPAATSRGGLRKADFVRPAGTEKEYTAEELLQVSGADPGLLAELEEYELIRGRQLSGVKRYGEIDVGIVGAAVHLAQAGLRPKNLRPLKSSVEREQGLIEQVLLPLLRSRRTDQRQEALDLLEEMVQSMTQLRQLLLTRAIRQMTS
jgi:DNA-binding transcriptional MerR regulator